MASAGLLVLSVALVAVLRASSYGGAKGAVGAVPSMLRETAAAGESSGADSTFSLSVSNYYERTLGIPIGDGQYPWAHLVEIHQPTTLTLSLTTGDELGDDLSAGLVWDVDEELDEGTATLTGASVVHAFKRLGKHAVHIHTHGGDSTSSATFEVMSKYVRRELRDLTEFDRDRYFSALHKLYTTPQAEGEEKYGTTFKSAAWLVREHLNGAADKECDHWHDDAGFFTHHVGITLQMETSLRLIDPLTCSHYWDYTIDAVSGVDYTLSPIFDGDWFGSANPNTTHHVIAHGRWAYTSVLQDARSFSNITNPYGLLRSPWNVNKVPYLARSRNVIGVSDAFYSLPKCSDFRDYLEESDDGISLASIQSALNGQLHGPVHIMTGGHWGFDAATIQRLHSFTHQGFTISPDQILLGAKFLWRQGYVRCPSYCGSDTPQEDCACECPTTIRNNRSSYEILADSGFTTLYALVYEQFIDGAGFTWDELLDMMCSVGTPGEMFTSSAPNDPLFWPLHGLAERFVQLVKLLAEDGVVTFDQTWGYEHSTVVASDTHVICDWSQVEGLHMPECTRGETCSGHKADDVLPFTNLLEGEDGQYTYTNIEFYELIAPWSDEMPYVYDKLTTWPGCTGGSLLVTTDDAASDTVMLPSV